MDALDPWLDAAVRSARASRERLAETSRRLRENPNADPAVYAMTDDLARIIGPLYAIELREPEGARAHLAEAMTLLVTLRDRLLASDPVGALSDVADALTRLHPNERALERATRPPPPPPPPPTAKAISTPPPPPPPSVRGWSTRPPSGRSTPPPAPPPPDRTTGWSTAPPSNDRRVSPRVRIETDIGYHSASNFYTGFTADLGDGGLFIATVQPLPEDTPITVSFVLPGGHHVVTDAVVRWVREGVDATVDIQTGMGVEFVGLPDEDLEAILAFVAQREPLFHV